MSQPMFVTHYMVRRPKVGNPASSRPFEDRIRHGARASGEARVASLPRFNDAPAVRRAG